MVSDPLVPLEKSVQGYSPGFLAALDRGLAVRPEQRPQSVAEFRELLGLRTIAPVTSMSASRRDPVPPTMIAPSEPDAGPQDTEAMDALSRSMMAGQPQSWIRSAAGEVPPTEVAPPAVTMLSPPEARAAGAARTVDVPRSIEVPRSVEVPRSIEVPRSVEVPRSMEVPRSLAVPPTGSSGPRPATPTIAKVPPADGTRSRATTIAPPPLTPSDYQEPKTVMTVLPSVLMGALLLLLMGGGVWWFSRAVPVAPVPPVADATPRPSAPSTSASSSAAAPAASGASASPPLPATGAAGPGAPSPAPPQPSASSTTATPASPDAKGTRPCGSGCRGRGAGRQPRCRAGRRRGRVDARGRREGRQRRRRCDTVCAAPTWRARSTAASRRRRRHPARTGRRLPDAPPPPPSGRVPLSVRPWGQIYVEGRNCGLSPPKKDLLLPEGKYKLEVRNPGFESHVENIEISARRVAPAVTHTFK